MTIVVPTLSGSGWLRSREEKADALLAHFYESDKLQSNIYGDNVSSLQWIIEEHGKDIVKVIELLEDTLNIYLGRYYDAVNTTVSETVNSNNEVTLRIYCRVSDGGKEYSFGNLLSIKNSKMIKVMNLNNDALT